MLRGEGCFESDLRGSFGRRSSVVGAARVEENGPGLMPVVLQKVESKSKGNRLDMPPSRLATFLKFPPHSPYSALHLKLKRREPHIF